MRSNGTVTYVGKDIAYQLWKFGLLGRDFALPPFHTYRERAHRVDQRGRAAASPARRRSATPPTCST